MIANHLAAAIANARALEEIETLKQRLELENEYLREEVTQAVAFGDLIGQSPSLQAVTRQIELVAPTNSAVLILGESGTGIPLLAEHFLARFSRQLGRRTPRLTLANVQELQRYDWPGNVRELQHALERACIVSTDGKLRFELVKEPLKQNAKTSEIKAAQEILTDHELRQLEANNIRAALSACNGKIYGTAGAAALLGMKPTTLASRIKALGINS